MKASFSLQHREVLVGSFVLVALVVFLGLVGLTVMRTEVFEDHFTLHAVFSMGIGISPGASVAMSGYGIGTVRNVELNPEGKILLTLRLKSDFQSRIRENSVATVRRLNPAVGDKIINLSQGSSELPMLKDGGFVNSENPVELEDALAHLTRVAANIEKIVSRVESGEGTAGALINDRNLIDSLDNLLGAGNKVLRNTGGLVRQLDALAGDVRSVLESLPGLMGRIEVLVSEAGVVAAKADTLMTIATRIAASAGPLLEEGGTLLGEATDVTHSVKRNWLIRGKLPKVKDELICEETRQ